MTKRKWQALTPEARRELIENAITKARAVAPVVATFDLDRLIRVEAEILRWRQSVDETATLGKLPKATGRILSGVKPAVDQIEKAKRELARGNLFGATYHLDRGENLYHMRRVNSFTATRIVHAAEEGQNVARGRARAGNKTAGILKRKATARDAHLKTEAEKIRASNPSITAISDLARILSERHGLGNVDVIRKKLSRLLRD